MKRYVMTKDKIIYDRTKMPTINFDLDASVDRTTDNLLDLLEVGDCVECDYGLHNETYTINNESELAAFKGDNTVVAIWKRNGDVMRRYEV